MKRYNFVKSIKKSKFHKKFKIHYKIIKEKTRDIITVKEGIINK